MRNRISDISDEYFSLYPLHQETDHCDHFIISTHENQFLFMPLDEDDIYRFNLPEKKTNSTSLIKDIRLRIR